MIEPLHIEAGNLFAVTGPTVKRGQSEQVVATPWAFIRAVEKKFGPLVYDLAATDENYKAPKWITPEQDTFKQNWAELLDGGLGWLNPEFDPMKLWAAKCAFEQKRHAEFVIITPASVSTNWYWGFVQPFATTHCLTPRIAFVGSHKLTKDGRRTCGELCEGCQPYPKDLALHHYHQNPSHELRRWRWK